MILHVDRVRTSAISSVWFGDHCCSRKNLEQNGEPFCFGEGRPGVRVPESACFFFQSSVIPGLDCLHQQDDVAALPPCGLDSGRNMSILSAVILEDSSGSFGIRYSAMGKTILRTIWISTSVDELPLARNGDGLRESYSPMLTSVSR